MDIDVIAVPYDSGRRGYRMGAGPENLIEAGLADRLRSAGHDVVVTVVDARDEGEGEPVRSAFALARAIARLTADARASDRLPLLLAGNCINTLGAVSALNGPDLGLVWFDAHADINTPETSTSGFLDGMSVATMLGWCHGGETAGLDGFTPLDAARVLLVGTRDLDPPELAAAERAGITMLAPSEAAGVPLGRALDGFGTGARRAYLHIDLDVLDPAAHGPANQFVAPGGLSADDVVRVARAIGARNRLAGVTISAYDPALDNDGTVGAAALSLLAGILPREPVSTQD